MGSRPRLAEILEALADERTLRIFRMGATGFEASLRTLSTMGLTRKQYYSRLETLLRLRLIEKSKGAYRQTILGGMIEDTQLKPLEQGIVKYWDVPAVDERLRLSVPHEETSRRMINSVTSEPEHASQPPNALQSPVQFIRSFDDVVQELTSAIKAAKKEIYLATRYFHTSVSQALIERFTAGVRISLLDGNQTNTGLTARMQAIMRASGDLQTQALALAILRSENFKTRKTSLEYSFFIIDGERCGIEIPDPHNTQQFNLALEFINRDFSARLIAHFRSLWDKAQEHAIKIEQK